MSAVYLNYLWVILISSFLLLEVRADWQALYYRDHPLVGKIYSTLDKNMISGQDLAARIENTQYLLLGETHTNPDHHIGQAQIIHEWLPADRQATLVLEMLAYDDWQQYSDSKFNIDQLNQKLEELAGEWKWELYAPIVQLKVDHELGLIGANLTRPQRAAFSKGKQCNITRSDITAEFCELLSTEQQEAIKQLIFDAHCSYLPLEHTGPLMHTQIAKDASFALSLSGIEPPYKAVLIAGAVHVRKDIGVPVHLRQLGKESVSIAFINVDPDKIEPEQYFHPSRSGKALNQQFDYVLFTPSERNQDPCVEFAEQLKRMKKH